MMNACHLMGGLQELAGMVNVRRIGVGHHAGSDSLLTAQVFFPLIKVELVPLWKHNPKQKTKSG